MLSAEQEQKLKELGIDPNDPCLVIYKGVPKYLLNQRLVESKGIGPLTLSAINQRHVEKLAIFEQMEATDDPTELKRLAAEVTKIEFLLQMLWGFEEDATYHDWYEVPKCTCPKMDNRERKGTPYAIHVQGCPIHWQE